jgi:hypothetical protein
VMVVSFIHDGFLSSGMLRLNSSNVRRYENVVLAIELNILYLIFQIIYCLLRFILKEVREYPSF